MRQAIIWTNDGWFTGAYMCHGLRVKIRNLAKIYVDIYHPSGIKTNFLLLKLPYCYPTYLALFAMSVPLDL